MTNDQLLRVTKTDVLLTPLQTNKHRNKTIFFSYDPLTVEGIRKEISVENKLLIGQIVSDLSSSFLTIWQLMQMVSSIVSVHADNHPEETRM